MRLSILQSSEIKFEGISGIRFRYYSDVKQLHNEFVNAHKSTIWPVDKRTPLSEEKNLQY